MSWEMKQGTWISDGGILPGGSWEGSRNRWYEKNSKTSVTS